MKSIKEWFNTKGQKHQYIDQVYNGDIQLETPQKEVQVMEKRKTMSEIVEEIHENFYTASDKALVEAKQLLETIQVDEKALMMKQLGFIQAKGVVENESVVNEQKRLQEEAEIIVHFQQKYPQYKYITVKDTAKVCRKYGLVLGTSDKYKGDIPTKNLMDIKNFDSDKIDKKDWQYKISEYRSESMSYVTEEIYEDYRKNTKRHPYAYWQCIKNLYIVAPIGDMDMGNSKLENGYKIVALDPVVLYPVTKGFLIITAWGPEANDELVVNQKMN